MTPKERAWLNAASRTGGNFISTFAKACLCADEMNFAILQAALARLMEKYPAYSGAAR